MIISAQVEQLGPLLRQALSADVFPGDNGSYPGFGSSEVEEVERQVNGVIEVAGPQLVKAFAKGMPEFLQQEGSRHPVYGPAIAAMDRDTAADLVAQKVVYEQILRKGGSFITALGVFELTPRMRGLAVPHLISGAGMYGGDQTMDRGYKPMVMAVSLVDDCGKRLEGDKAEAKQWLDAGGDEVRRCLGFLSVTIGKSIDEYTHWTDTGIVRRHFYGNVLGNELRHRELTDAYRRDEKGFWERHAQELARITTISAGFPSISTSWYAIFRQQDDLLGHKQTLPELMRLYQDDRIWELDQVCNVVARLLDELGDWRMDAGITDMGIFVVNPFNQHDERFVDEYCRLGKITGDARDKLQHAIENFHKDRPRHRATVMDLLKAHIQDYMDSVDSWVKDPTVDSGLRPGYLRYVTMCKRVMEICFVNAIGDPALASADLKAE